MTTHSTRRGFLSTVGAAAGSVLIAQRSIAAQARQGTPLSAPTVISNPPDDRSGVQRTRAAEYTNQAPLDRRIVGGGSRVVQPGTVSLVE